MSLDDCPKRAIGSFIAPVFLGSKKVTFIVMRWYADDEQNNECYWVFDG